MELETHNLNNVLGLIYLGLDSPKMLSTSNAHPYFSTCLKLPGTIHALRTKHMLTCSVGRCPERAAGGRLQFTLRNMSEGCLCQAHWNYRNCCPFLLRLFFQEPCHSMSGTQRGDGTSRFTLHPGESIDGSTTSWCVKQGHILSFSGIWETWPCICSPYWTAYKAGRGV